MVNSISKQTLIKWLKKGNNILEKKHRFAMKGLTEKGNRKG